MKINKNKQRGATMVSWLIGAGVAILLASAVVKVAPYYVEFNSVKGLMKNIASEPGIQKADKRAIYSKVEKYLTLNNLRSLEASYYGSKDKSKRIKNPFTVTKLKNGNKRKKLMVEYPVKTNWFYNLNFLIDFKHSVILGEPDNKTGK